jgi:hypothetical protein
MVSSRKSLVDSMRTGALSRWKAAAQSLLRTRWRKFERALAFQMLSPIERHICASARQ